MYATDLQEGPLANGLLLSLFLSDSSKFWICSNTDLSRQGPLLSCLTLPWFLDDIELGISFNDGDALVVHALVGVDYELFSCDCVKNSYAIFLVRCIRVDGNFMNSSILLDRRDVPERTIVAHFQFQRLRCAVDNLCCNHICWRWCTLFFDCSFLPPSHKHEEDVQKKKKSVLWILVWLISWCTSFHVLQV